MICNLIAPTGLFRIPSTTPLDPSLLYHFSVQLLLKQILIITEKQVNKNTTNLTVDKKVLLRPKNGAVSVSKIPSFLFGVI